MADPIFWQYGLPIYRPTFYVAPMLDISDPWCPLFLTPALLAAMTTLDELDGVS